MHRRDTLHDHKSLIFLHIPKAAGTTLNRVIERQYPERATFSIDGGNVYESIEEFKSLSNEQRDGFLCLKGHMPFGLHLYMAQPCAYITLLRDPVDRMISHYYYVLRTPNHYLYEQVVSREMTLEDYVGSDISTELQNGQTKLLAGDEKNPPRNMLRIAKRNLREHFMVVGLTERFDESLVLMKKRLCWDDIRYRPRNVTRSRPSRNGVPLSTVRLIEERNQKDLELYAFARQLFERDTAQLGRRFAFEVVAFQLWNRVYHALSEARGLGSRGYRWLLRRMGGE